MKKNPYIGVAILLGVGTLLIASGILWFSYHLHFINTAHITNGTVIELVNRSRGYSPRVEFADLQGNSHIFTSRSSQSPALAQPGESIPVFYDPAQPSRALIYSFVSLWFGPLMLYIAGSINILLGIIVWRIITTYPRYLRSPD